MGVLKDGFSFSSAENIVGGLFGLGGLFGDDDVAAERHAQVMRALSEILDEIRLVHREVVLARGDILKTRKEMHQRFDRLEHQLFLAHYDLAERMGWTIDEVRKLSNKIEEIDYKIDQLSVSSERARSENNDQWAKLNRKDFDKALGLLEAKIEVGRKRPPLTDQEKRDTLLAIWNHANDVSYDELISGSNLEIEDLLKEHIWNRPSQYTFDFIPTLLGEEGINFPREEKGKIDDGLRVSYSLPNPNDYLRAIHAYLEFHAKHPDVSDSETPSSADTDNGSTAPTVTEYVTPSQVNKMIESGHKLIHASEVLKSKSLLNTLLEDYERIIYQYEALVIDGLSRRSGNPESVQLSENGETSFDLYKAEMKRAKERRSELVPSELSLEYQSTEGSTRTWKRPFPGRAVDDHTLLTLHLNLGSLHVDASADGSALVSLTPREAAIKGDRKVVEDYRDRANEEHLRKYGPPLPVPGAIWPRSRAEGVTVHKNIAEFHESITSAWSKVKAAYDRAGLYTYVDRIQVRFSSPNPVDSGIPTDQTIYEYKRFRRHSEPIDTNPPVLLYRSEAAANAATREVVECMHGPSGVDLPRIVADYPKNAEMLHADSRGIPERNENEIRRREDAAIESLVQDLSTNKDSLDQLSLTVKALEYISDLAWQEVNETKDGTAIRYGLTMDSLVTGDELIQRMEKAKKSGSAQELLDTVRELRESARDFRARIVTGIAAGSVRPREEIVPTLAASVATLEAFVRSVEMKHAMAIREQDYQARMAAKQGIGSWQIGVLGGLGVLGAAGVGVALRNRRRRSNVM